MSLSEVLFLALIEGITEFLPVSSTAHLMLAAKLLSLNETEFLKTFEIVIQGGAVSAVLFLYLKKLFSQPELIKKILVGFLPSGILGLIFYSWFRFFLTQLELALVMLFLGGVILIVFEKFFVGREKTEISLRDAFLIGLAQSLAMIPGVSRALVTFITARGLGYSRKTAVEFSFLLALPTLLAATAWDVFRHFSWLSLAEGQKLGLGFGLAFLSALISVKFLLRLTERTNFINFGLYRIGLALLVWGSKLIR